MVRTPTSTPRSRLSARALLDRFARPRRLVSFPNSVFANDALARLRRFEPFAQMDWYSLSSYARRARVVRLPAGRWITRSPRQLTGAWYLSAGVVQDKDSGKLLRAASRRCRAPIYPGASNLQTLSAVALVHIDESDLRLISDAALPQPSWRSADAPPAQQAGSTPHRSAQSAVPSAARASQPEVMSWLETLATSPVLRALYRRRGAKGWQSWLRALDCVAVPQQHTVIREGTVGDSFYIVAQGRAAVQSASGELLRYVRPGGFFGEDALLTGQLRNADVTVCAGGRLLRGDYDQLAQLIDDLWWALMHGALGCSDVPQGGDVDRRFYGLPSELPTTELRRLLCDLPRDVSFQIPLGEHAAELDLLLLLLTHRGFLLQR